MENNREIERRIKEKIRGMYRTRKEEYREKE